MARYGSGAVAATRVMSVGGRCVRSRRVLGSRCLTGDIIERGQTSFATQLNLPLKTT